ncbi:MAG: DsbA family protein [Chloroflexi bacterium]|nr:MAG: DsbA family protein [Chloroflexota bacterium]
MLYSANYSFGCRFGGRDHPKGGSNRQSMAKKSQLPERKGSRPVGSKPVERGSNRRILWIAIGAAVVLVAVLVVVAIAGNRNRTVSSSESQITFSERVGQPVDRRIIGDPNAPVLIEAYEDFQCPHCQDFTATMEDTIMDELVAPGLARFQFRNRFVINSESVTIALAAECAADQGKFWEYHDAVFAEISRNPRTYQAATLKKLASEVGLDREQFDKCFDTREHFEALLREDNEARNRGVNGTPTVFINGERYGGSFDPAEFKAAVEAAAGS